MLKTKLKLEMFKFKPQCTKIYNILQKLWIMQDGTSSVLQLGGVFFVFHINMYKKSTLKVDYVLWLSFAHTSKI